MSPQIAILLAVILFVGGVYVIATFCVNISRLCERIDRLEKAVSRLEKRNTHIIGRNWV